MFEKICYFCSSRRAYDMEFCPDDGTPLAVTPIGSLSGVVIGKRYELIEEIGKGEVGVVYKARHLQMDNMVAVKLLMTDPEKDTDILERFRIEARAASMLNHPSVIRIFDFDVMEGGVPYLVMEYLEGQTLNSLLDAEGTVETTRALKLCIQVCSALSHAHRRNVVHRDVKPLNIVVLPRELDEPERAVLLDFGIAKVFKVAGATLQKLTKSGQIFNSPLYMSPEQCMGQFSDVRSDIYSMGCLIYHLITGAPPFRGKNYLQTVFMHINETPDDLSARVANGACPKGLNEVVLKALMKSPDRRQQAMQELKLELERILAGLVAEPASPPADAGGTQENHGLMYSLEEYEALIRDLNSKNAQRNKNAGKSEEASSPDLSDPRIEHEHGATPADPTLGDEDAEEVRDDEVVQDPDDPTLHKTIRDYLKRGGRGQASDMYDLAWHYRTGDRVKRNMKRARYWFFKAAEAGDLDAMMIAGNIYYYGHGVKKSYKDAFKWWLRAAEAGHLTSMYAVGNAYTCGWGVKVDVEKAVPWYVRAGEKGSIPALKRLADVYQDGIGVEASIEKAAEWWLKAAQKGDKHAQYYIGYCYLTGTGVPSDNAEALGWLECSAGQGYCLAKVELSWCYEQGLGVEVDMEEARRLLTQAAESGCPYAREILDGGQRRQQLQGQASKPTSRKATDPKSTTDWQAVSSAEVWGVHGRAFDVRDDGSALYRVRGCETLEMIAKDIQRTIYTNAPEQQPDRSELRELATAVKQANTDIVDFDLLDPGLNLVIPKVIVARVKAARGEALVIKINGRTTEIFLADGIHRSIHRDAAGEAIRVVDVHADGSKTTFRRKGDIWVVRFPKVKVDIPYSGVLRTD